MKLIFCPHCGDIKRIRGQFTVCYCLRSCARYVASHQVECNEEAIILGLNSKQLGKAKYRVLNGYARGPLHIGDLHMLPRRNHRNIQRDNLPDWVDLGRPDTNLRPPPKPVTLRIGEGVLGLYPPKPSKSRWRRALDCLLGRD